jgi:hypothetical protein
MGVTTINNGAGPSGEPLESMESMESALGASMERMVGGKGFAGLIGLAAENAVALSTINAQVWDMVLRNLRLAGRSDVHKLGRRLNRIEDKLEMLLQEVERLGEADRRT